MRGAARPPRGSGGTPPVGEDAVVTLHQILNSSWHKPDYRDRIELAPNVPVQADVHPCLLSNLHRFMGFGPSGLIFVDMHYYKKYRNYPLIIQLFSYIMWTCMSPAPL